MTAECRLLHVANGITAAAADPARWGVACDHAAEQLGALAFNIFAWDPGTATLQGFRASSRLLREAPALVSDLADLPMPAAEAAIYNTAAHGPREAFRSTAEILGVATNADLPPNAFYDALRMRLPVRCRAGARLGDTGPMLDIMAAQFSWPDEDMPDSVRAEANALAPFVGRAVEANRVIEGLTGRLALLSAAFDRFDFGVVLADANGRMHLANHAARAMMAEGTGVAEASGRIATPTAPGALTCQVTAAARGRLAGRASLVPLPRGMGRPLIARVFAVSESGVPDARACILLVDPDDPERVDSSGITALGLLTGAEAEVVALLVRGADTGEIAVRRDTTPETARGQIKSATAKLDCRTRADLVRLAMATRPPAREDGS